MTIARVWRTRIDQRRAEEYRRFADEASLPMFRAHEGFVGAVFGEAHDERVVITLWRDSEAVAALDSSPVYRDTVQRIEATGFILGPSSVEVFEVHGGAIDGTL
jgi:heme-degrading monooxygenase HmoA